MDRTLTDAVTLGQSGSGSNGNKWVSNTTQISKTGSSSSGPVLWHAKDIHFCWRIHLFRGDAASLFKYQSVGWLRSIGSNLRRLFFSSLIPEIRGSTDSSFFSLVNKIKRKQKQNDFDQSYYSSEFTTPFRVSVGANLCILWVSLGLEYQNIGLVSESNSNLIIEKTCLTHSSILIQVM